MRRDYPRLDTPPLSWREAMVLAVLAVIIVGGGGYVFLALVGLL